jgi:multicomponent Na+:H+ antiporter subunit E
MAKIFFLIVFTFMLAGSTELAAIAKMIGIVAASLSLTHLLCRNERSDRIGLKIGPNLLVYLLRLVEEIFTSALSVCEAIFFKKESELSPIVAEIRTRQKTDEAKVLLGNSITLTPGTITIDILEDKIVVHAIDAKCLKGCKELDFKIMQSQR